MYRVLLVEDDQTIAKIIQYYLGELREYEVTWAKDAGEALYASREPFDIVLLDVMLPDVDGVELCGKLRERMYCPIIFISCIDDEDTIVRALEMGGDDYLTKPFNCKVLQARMEANLRRVLMERQTRKRTRLAYPGFTIDVGGHAIERDGKTLPLAPIEFGILMYLADHAHTAVTLDTLYQSVWGENSYGDVRTVIVHIYNLRKKLGQGADGPQYIKNIRGKGYCFDPTAGGEPEERQDSRPLNPP